VERLAPEAIVASHNGTDVRAVLLLTECKFYDDCTFRYHGVEMRGDGESFELRFHTVRARPGRLSALSVFRRELNLSGNFVGVCKALNIRHTTAVSGPRRPPA
jgi:hypothetical protein